MAEKVSDERAELMRGLYNNGKGLNPAEIATQTGVSYTTAYIHTRLKQRNNPETGQLFESRSQYQEHRARQRLNPDTGKLFESLKQYLEYTARRRQKRPENQGLSNLIKKRLKEMGKNQFWLSSQMGISIEITSKYVQGTCVATGERLEKLFSVLGIPCRTLEDLSRCDY